MAEFLPDLKENETKEIYFPFDDASQFKNGKWGFGVKVDGENYRLGATERLGMLLKDALGASSPYEHDGRVKMSYTKGQVVTVTRQGGNPALDKTEAFKDPEFTVHSERGTFATGTPSHTLTPDGEHPSDAPRSTTPAPAAPAAQVATTKFSLADRMDQLDGLYEYCVDKAVERAQLSHGLDPKKPKATDNQLIHGIAVHYAIGLQREGYATEFQSEPDPPQPEAEAPEATTEPDPTPAPSPSSGGEPPDDDDLPF